jgi:hypothetical protein
MEKPMGAEQAEEIERARATLQAAGRALEEAVTVAIDLASRREPPEPSLLALAAAAMDDAMEAETAAYKRLDAFLALRRK